MGSVVSKLSINTTFVVINRRRDALLSLEFIE